MGNLYYVTKCPQCGKAVEADFFTVHGVKNLTRAMELLRELPLSQVAARFCGYCGEEMPCGCPNPSPQRKYSGERR